MGNHYITRTCDSCENCVSICPTKSIFFGAGHYVIDADTCVDCGICAQVCHAESVLVRAVSSAPSAAEPQKKPGS